MVHKLRVVNIYFKYKLLSMRLEVILLFKEESIIMIEIDLVKIKLYIIITYPVMSCTVMKFIFII
ncbi:hypothetical protein DHD05_10015 [Arenibacter sp. N53]|nr:hypothetical protein [Arenibacter sp. N53]